MNNNFEKSYSQFMSRLGESVAGTQMISNIVYMYYLARISKLWKHNSLETSNRFQEVI